MDEPLVHLDTTQRNTLWVLLKNYVEERQASLVFASHQAEEVLGYAHQVVFLKEGKLIYQGGVSDLYYQPESEELAHCLGPVNWLTKQESSIWLSDNEHHPNGLRPEQLQVVANDKGAFSVISALFQGSLEEVLLEHKLTRAQHTFFHRPVSDQLHTGMSVYLKVCRTNNF